MQSILVDLDQVVQMALLALGLLEAEDSTIKVASEVLEAACQLHNNLKCLNTILNLQQVWVCSLW